SVLLSHAKIEYLELLWLLQAKWVSPDPALPLQIERPAGTCDLDKQRLRNFSPAAADRVNRFLRVWRRTPWQMWELDLLIRAPRLGAGALDASTLIALHHAKLLQDRLHLDAERVAGLYGLLNTDVRIQPDQPGR